MYSSFLSLMSDVTAQTDMNKQESKMSTVTTQEH